MSLDVLIRGGTVIDGTGAAPRVADVAVEGGRIAAVEQLNGARADTVFDATGRYVVPGFIDTNVHGETALLQNGVHEPALRQGVTTYLLGQDGISAAPGRQETLAYVRRYFAAINGDPLGIDWHWRSVAEYLERFDQTSTVNVAYLVPNANVRLDVIGKDPRPATHDELARMRRMVAEGLEQGAVGLSSGLDYGPSRLADTDELAALCEPVARAGGVYVTHMRGYGARAPEGMAEVREIARRTGVAAHVSHFSGPGALLAGLVDDAHAGGVDLTFDSYPYSASSTLLSMLVLPEWAREGGPDDILARLANPRVRPRLRRDIAARSDVFERATLSNVAAVNHTWSEGLTIAAAADRLGSDPAELVCELLLSSRMDVGVVLDRPDRDEDDLRVLHRHPAHMAGSGGIFCGGRPHPRGWGTFARYLARFTRDLGDWDWTQAVAHLSTNAARRLGLADRGELRAGMAADVVVLDPRAIYDRATLGRPRRPASGVEVVLVNGVVALVGRGPTGATPGRALRRAA